MTSAQTSFPTRHCSTQGVRLVSEGAGGGRKLSLPFNLSERANQSRSYAGSSKTSLFGLTTGFTE